jgi:exonuclease III
MKKLKQIGYIYQYEHASTKLSRKWGYAGVIVLSKIEPCKFVTGIGDEELDKEGRHIDLYFPNITISGTYAPNSGNRAIYPHWIKKLYTSQK